MFKHPNSLRRAVLAAAVALALTACGQKGPLVLPTGPAAAQRSTLPELLQPDLPLLLRPSNPSASSSTVPTVSPTAAPLR
jgi:predicted small lipoprotein YifL